jgi:hypothetical protein
MPVVEIKHISFACQTVVVLMHFVYCSPLLPLCRKFSPRKKFWVKFEAPESIMGSTDKYCLRWNDYRANLSSAFQVSNADKNYFNCTGNILTLDLQRRASIFFQG